MGFYTNLEFVVVAALVKIFNAFTKSNIEFTIYSLTFAFEYGII